MPSQNCEPVIGGETSNQRLARVLLGQSVHAFIAERRAADKPASWRSISRELSTLTDGQVDVTEVTLRAWHSAGQDAAA